MSHTWHKGVSFIGNSDLSGDVEIVRNDGGREIRFEVPGDALVDFVASYLVRRKISRLEDEDPLVSLGVKSPR